MRKRISSETIVNSNWDFHAGSGNVHRMADEHECDMCGQTFDSEDELVEHAEEEHDKEM